MKHSSKHLKGQIITDDGGGNHKHTITEFLLISTTMGDSFALKRGWGQ